MSEPGSNPIVFNNCISVKAAAFHSGYNDVMVGINGTGGNACTEGGVGAHYRLDTEEAQDWIEEQLLLLDSDY